MVEILALVLHHDEQAVLTAVELALADGVPSKTHVLNQAAQADRQQTGATSGHHRTTGVDIGQ
jgi:hypothetical protein